MIAAALPREIASDLLATVRMQMATFGLSAARLDIREDSGRLAAALGGILDALGIDAGFAGADDARRTAVLLRLLSEKPPAAADLAVAAVATEESAEAWRLFRLLARVRSLYGMESLGPFIVSMTRGAADLLSVLLLARWAGCVPAPDIAPLFETLDDLDAAPPVLSQLFAPAPYPPPPRP